MNIISTLLMNYRKINGLKQRETVDQLQKYNTIFDGVNTVSLSRWETGTVHPSKSRKIMLLQFLFFQGCLREEACLNLFTEHYTLLQEPTEDSFNMQLEHMIGNFPEPHKGGYTLQQFRKVTDNKELLLDTLLHIEQSMSMERYYPISPGLLEQWCNHPASFVLICEERKQYAGHYVLLKLKNTVAEDIVFHRKNIFSLHEEDFCAQEEKGTYLSFALYARSPKVAAMLTVEHYLFLLENSAFIDNVAIYSTREDIHAVIQRYGVNSVASGEEKASGVRWHGFIAPLEEILFSESIVESIF